MHVHDLQTAVEIHDNHSWLHPAGPETDIHNTLHVLKTAGKIAAHSEAIQDGRANRNTPLDPALVADLAIEALRYASNHGFDLGDAIGVRLEALRARAQHETAQT